MKKIIEGLWDCPYCGSKAIGGLTKKCPVCGHPQDINTKFYLGKKKKYLDPLTAKQYGKEPDWVCPKCTTLNRYMNQLCTNCSTAKSDAEKDYFGNKIR